MLLLLVLAWGCVFRRAPDSSKGLGKLHDQKVHNMCSSFTALAGWNRDTVSKSYRT